MTEGQQQRVAQELQAAYRALDDAHLLVREQRAESAISRAYYAIFHAARAALAAHGSRPITHRGVKTEFGRLLVKSGLLEEEYNTILQEARDQRQVADYESGERELVPDLELARDVADKAQRFVDRMQAFSSKGQSASL